MSQETFSPNQVPLQLGVTRLEAGIHIATLVSSTYLPPSAADKAAGLSLLFKNDVGKEHSERFYFKENGAELGSIVKGILGNSALTPEQQLKECNKYNSFISIQKLKHLFVSGGLSNEKIFDSVGFDNAEQYSTALAKQYIGQGKGKLKIKLAYPTKVNNQGKAYVGFQYTPFAEPLNGNRLIISQAEMTRPGISTTATAKPAPSTSYDGTFPDGQDSAVTAPPY